MISRVYLDYQSTTPVDHRVLRAMLPHFCETFGNPHSAEHSFGLDAAGSVNHALVQLANAINTSPEDLILVSGATEANNMALRGLIGKKKSAHFISCVTEHKSILGTLTALKEDGHQVTLLPVDADGFVDPDAVAAAIKPSTVMVSVMAVNSEIGVIQPYADIGQLCRSREVLLHVDAAQGYGKVAIDVLRDCIDLMSFSAHKIYGPKGIGALYIRPELRHRLRPLITGGGQQDGLRAGTVPTPLAVGFGHAAELMQLERDADQSRIAALQARLWVGLQDRIDSIFLNGSFTQRIAGNLNFRIAGIDADSLLLMVPDLALSTGSACNSGALEPSPVLLALGLSSEYASQSVRIGLGRMTTVAEIDFAIERLAQAVTHLRV